jgi:hypothetical protein
MRRCCKGRNGQIRSISLPSECLASTTPCRSVQRPAYFQFMSVPLPFLDFLNSREKASVVWLVVIVIFVATKSGRDFAGGVVALVRTALHPKLALLFGSAALYSAAVVYLAANAGVWHRDILKETIYWFVGTGVILVGGAIGSPNKPGLLGRVARKTFRFTIFLEFFVSLYVFPIWVEIFFVPVMIVFSVMQAYTEATSSFKQVHDLANRFLSVVGWALLAWAVFSVVHDLHGFFSRETAERLWVPAGLSVALLPFLFLVARYSEWELARARAHPV